MRLAPIGLAIALGGCAAQTVDGIRAENERFFSQDFTCTAKSATLTTYDTLYEHRDVFLNRCVRIRAYTDGYIVVAGPTGLGERSPPTLAFSDIALEWQEGVERPSPGSVEMVGRVRSCSEISERVQRAIDAEAAAGKMPRGSAWLTGACHSFATVLHVSLVRPLPID